MVAASSAELISRCVAGATASWRTRGSRRRHGERRTVRGRGGEGEADCERETRDETNRKTGERHGYARDISRRLSSAEVGRRRICSNPLTRSISHGVAWENTRMGKHRKSHRIVSSLSPSFADVSALGSAICNIQASANTRRTARSISYLCCESTSDAKHWKF